MLPNLTGVNSPFDILDIDESSSPEEIKKRYKQLSLGAQLIHTHQIAMC